MGEAEVDGVLDVSVATTLGGRVRVGGGGMGGERGAGAEVGHENIQ